MCGITKPCRSRAWRPNCGSRAARWAAPAPSTARSTCAAHRPTMTIGRPWVARAGAGSMSARTSWRWKTTSSAPPRGAERAVRCTSACTRRAIPCAKRCSRPPFKRARRALPTSTTSTTVANGGMGYQPVTTYRGKRYSAARAFLAPARARSNLDVLTDTDVQRIEFQERRATGITVKDRDGTRSIPVSGELILAAGAIESPEASAALGDRSGGALAHSRDSRRARCTGRRQQFARAPLSRDAIPREGRQPERSLELDSVCCARC